MVAVGIVVGLDYRDTELSVHDLLQELKTHPRLRPIFEGGERLQWGAKTIPEGGFVSLPKRFHAPGLLLAGDGVGLVNVPALKGIHYADRVGTPRGRGGLARVRARIVAPGALASYDDVAARVVPLARPARGPEHAPGLRPRLLARLRLGRHGDGVEGAVPAEGQADRA